jgi:hypothetical protein
VRKFSRKTTIIASTLALIVVTSVVAYAFWLNTGAGSGSGSTGTNIVTVNQQSTPSGLVPGGPAQELFGGFNNGNGSPVHVNHVIATLTAVAGGPGRSDLPECSIHDFTLTGNPTLVDADIPVGSNQGHWGGIMLSMVNASYNQENCKNVTVFISYSTD